MQENIKEVIQFLDSQGMKPHPDIRNDSAVHLMRPLKIGARKTSEGSVFNLQALVTPLEDGGFDAFLFVSGSPNNKNKRHIDVGISFYDLADLKKEFRMTEDRLSFCLGELS